MSLILHGFAPALFGVGLVVWGVVDRTWQGVAFGAALAVSLGWLSVHELTTTHETQAGEEVLLREALRDAPTA